MDHLPPFLQDIVNFLQPVIDTGQDIYNSLAGFILWQNSGIDYLLIPVIFFVAFLTSYIVKFIMIRRMKGILPSKVSSFSNPVLDQVKQLINFKIVFIIALFLSTQHLTLNDGLQLLFDIVIFGALIWSLFTFGSGLIDASAEYREQTTESDQTHILSFLTLIGKVIVASLLALWYLTLLDVNVTGLAAGLGIAGITIAFALQSIVSDLFAAVAIYMDRPFEIGDYINVNDRSGRIERIGIRTTHIRSVDGPLIVMSNQNLTQADIINYQKMEERRIQQVIGVSADTPIDLLRKLPELIEDRISSIELIRIDKIWLKSLGDFSWNYEIIFFVEEPGMDKFREVQEELNYRILELMEELDVEIPYPIQEIILNEKNKIIQPSKTTADQIK